MRLIKYCAINTLWMLLCLRQAYLFRQAARNVAAIQRKLLFKILKNNRKTAFGRKYRFKSITSISDFESRVPLSIYEDYKPYIRLISAGQKNILTSDPVAILEPTSGSTSASKYIPYTKSLLRGFKAAIAPWVYDMFVKRKKLLSGRAYWSVTPVSQEFKHTAGGIPIGFNEDSEYFGAIEQHLLKYILAVPQEVSQIDDIAAFRYTTLLFLLKERNLAFISIWNPTFLSLLLEPLAEWHGSLIDDLSNGMVNPPGKIHPKIMKKIVQKLPKDVARAEELKSIFTSWKIQQSKQDNYSYLYKSIWPNLILISCWADGNAAMHLGKLRKMFPDIEIQPKGLIATEGIISFPLAGEIGCPLAIRSHFLEFIESGGDNTQDIKLAHELEIGRRYSVIITTSGGLYRYRMQDIIKVLGFKNQCPLITFVGKEDSISDLFGEKLNERHISVVLNEMFKKYSVFPAFYMVAPENDKDKNAHFYTLFLQADRLSNGDAHAILRPLSLDIEERLQRNYHYKYCRSLGQLAEFKIFLINSGAKSQEIYLRTCQSLGHRLGNIKSCLLHSKNGWSKVFPGSFVEKN